MQNFIGQKLTKAVALQKILGALECTYIISCSHPVAYYGFTDFFFKILAHSVASSGSHNSFLAFKWLIFKCKERKAGIRKWK